MKTCQDIGDVLMWKYTTLFAYLYYLVSRL